MKPIWFRQLVVYAGLGLLAVPIYFVDHWLFAPRGSGWIALDFREILFWSYLICLALCTVVSSIVLSAFLGARKVGVQLTLMGLSIVLLLTGSFVYGKSAVLERKSTIPKRDGTSKGARDVIELKRWDYFPNDVSTAEIRGRGFGARLNI